MKKATLIAMGFAVAAQLACAHQAGKGAAKGAMEEVAEQGGEQQPGQPPMATSIVSDAVRGGLEQLSQPEQVQQLGEVLGYAFGRSTRSALAQLLAPPAGSLAGGGVGGTGAEVQGSAVQQIADQAATAFAAAFARETVAQLGERADGPLAESLSAAGERISGSVLRGATEGLGTAFPECSGPDREECIKRHLGGLTRSASEGVADVVMDKMRPWLLALTAATAIMFGLAVLWGLAVLRRLGPLRGSEEQRARS